MHKISLSTVTSLVKHTIFQKLTGPAIAGVLLSVLPVVFSSALTYYAIVHEPVIRELTGWQWMGLTILFAVTSAGLTPPTVLALIFGYFLGWQAVLPLFVINFGGILLINLIVHWVNRDQLLRFVRQNPKAQSVLDRILDRELAVIFFAKLSPILPFGLTNLVFALSGAKLKNILLGGFLGMAPRTLLAIWSGREAREIQSLLNDPNQSTWGQVIVVVLVLISIAGLWRVLRGALKKRV